MEVTWLIVIVCLSVSQLEAKPTNGLSKSEHNQIYRRTTHDVRHPDNVKAQPKRRLSFWERYYDKYLHKENYYSTNIDIGSSPRLFNILMDRLRHRGIDYDTLSDNIPQDLMSYVRESFAALPGDYFQAFRPFGEMLSFMEEAVSRCDGRCSLFDIGKSYEGRPLTGIKIGSPSKTGQTKPKIWIDAGIHAREWISHTTALFIADMLIEHYKDEKFVRKLVDNYDWYILPCVNPDGYNYTWTKDRMWRKTRRPNPNSKCIGTDANRNFAFQWGRHGSSSDPCKDNYRGPHAFSEPEARAVANFIESEGRKGSWLVYLTLHSKGQLVMSPWGFTELYPGDYKELARVGKAMTRAISDTHNKLFVFGSAAQILYRSSGTSRDWARGHAGIKYVYTLELRAQDSSHWMLYPREIIPTGQEVWAGVKATMKAIEGREPGEENHLETFLTTTTRSPEKQRDVLKQYSRRNGRPPISW